MSVSVNPPKTPVTKGSNGIAVATLPNICKMPGPPAPFIPVPLPNIGKSGDSPKGYTKKVKVKKKIVAVKGASFKSMGDMASKGTGGGLISANTHGPCKFISPGSMDVKFEGKNVHLLTDMVTNNGGPSGTPPNAATMMGAIQAPGVVYIVRKENCPVCHKEHDDLAESEATQADAQGILDAYGATGAYKKAMIGVVHCAKGHKHAHSTQSTDYRFTDSVKDYHFVAQDKQPNTIEKMQDVTQNSPTFQRALQQANLAIDIQSVYRNKQNPLPEEREEASVSRNPPGACAAQKALVAARLHGCTPSAMTEKWFSKARPASEDVTALPAKTAGPIRHFNIDGKLDTAEFHDGDSVPPCETCNLLIPFLTCQEENSCVTPVKGCKKC